MVFLPRFGDTLALPWVSVTESLEDGHQLCLQVSYGFKHGLAPSRSLLIGVGSFRVWSLASYLRLEGGE
jgi:hypothetical protein